MIDLHMVILALVTDVADILSYVMTSLLSVVFIYFSLPQLQATSPVDDVSPVTSFLASHFLGVTLMKLSFSEEVKRRGMVCSASNTKQSDQHWAS